MAHVSQIELGCRWVDGIAVFTSVLSFHGQTSKGEVVMAAHLLGNLGRIFGAVIMVGGV
jgi:hypothetical protein